MQLLAAYSTLALTLGVVATRPRIRADLRIHPAVAAWVGVVVMMLVGVVHLADLREATDALWRPTIGIVCILLVAAAAHRVGVVDAIAARTIGRVKGSPARLFAAVFALSAVVSALLNNDAAVLLLTPIVVRAVRTRYARRDLVLPFAFAVFMAAGVAPLVISNPMNMVVASCAHIGFNEYAVRMVPVAVVSGLVAFGVLRVLFARTLAAAAHLPAAEREAPRPLTGAQRALLVLLPCAIVAYSVLSAIGAPIWPAALACALLALALVHRAKESVRAVVAGDVSWGVLAFLVAVFLLAIGMRNVGIVDALARLYEHGGPAAATGASAVGSALLNNHPMAILNVLALQANDGTVSQTHVLAALVGGDLGPRLLPTGSLAGLLWLEALRKGGVDVSIRRFVLVGAAVTLPSIVASLAVLLFG